MKKKTPKSSRSGHQTEQQPKVKSTCTLTMYHFQDLLENKRDLVVGVGVSTGGRVNSETGEILFATKVLSGWGGVALKTRLQEQLGLPCYVENDGNCAALAEVFAFMNI